VQKTIAIIGALDTKGKDFCFVKSEIEKRGHRALVINVGVLGEPPIEPDFSAEQVAQSGGVSLKELRTKQDHGLALDVMAKGVAKLVKELHHQGRIDGVFSMGGTGGTSLGTAAMRVLPIGVPKVMVTTTASGNTSRYVQSKDIALFPSIVDVAGVNRISSRIYANAVGAVVGMVETQPPEYTEKPLVAATMLGNTTPIVYRCQEIIENQGYEVLLFHAVGSGGETMERLMEENCFEGVLDVSLSELANEHVGGDLTAGTSRLDMGARKGVPQVILPGGLDIVSFWGYRKAPEKFEGRLFYQWNPNIILMRTNPGENEQLGRIVAEKLNKCTGPVAVFLPLKGLTILGGPSKEFWWPEADHAFFNALKKHLRPDIPVYEMDYNINDREVADAAANKLLEFLRTVDRKWVDRDPR
jgi:uncharacterized protein (UPF0261 family)